jgi:hypothetical protein
MTPLSWCIVVSTAANVAIATMVGWFLLVRPAVHVIGGVSVYGGVHVDGGTIEVTTADKDTIQKVQICEQTSELSKYPLPPNNRAEMVPVIHCASIDPSGHFAGFDSYGLGVVPARQ